jgi:hypothetical protein
MRNNERSISIGPIGLRAMWARMHHRNVLHRDDVNVEAARAEPHRWYAAEEPLKFLDAREHLNGRRRRLLG